MAYGDEDPDRRRLMRTSVAATVLLCLACAPDGSDSEPVETASPRPFEAPVATNAEPPVAYPVDLFEQGVEGTVIIRLYVDETGTIVPDSTLVAESSGIPALDNAALAGVEEMNFAPARRDGIPVSTLFYQPVHFRVPGGDASRERS